MEEIWMIFSKIVSSPEFMVGGCTQIAFMFSAHTNHISEVKCAEERQKLATESTVKIRKKEPKC